MSKSFFSKPIKVSTEISKGLFIVNFKGYESIIIRPFNLNKDLDEVYRWFVMGYASMWGMDELSKNQVKEIYQGVLASQTDNAYIGMLSSNQRQLFLFHCYEPYKNKLADYYKALPTDRGTHKIIAPTLEKIDNLTWFVFRAINEFVFSDSNVQRIVDEPNIYNHKYYIACKQAGYDFHDVIHLPDKTSQLVMLRRKRFHDLQKQAPMKKDKLLLRQTWVWLRMLCVRKLNKIKSIINKEIIRTDDYSEIDK